MEQSPWEGYSRSASQKIPRRLCNPNVHYRIHETIEPYPEPIEPSLHPNSLFQGPLNITSHLRLGLPDVLFPWSFPTEFFMHFLSFLPPVRWVKRWNCNKNSLWQPSRFVRSSQSVSLCQHSVIQSAHPNSASVYKEDSYDQVGLIISRLVPLFISPLAFRRVVSLQQATYTSVLKCVVGLKETCRQEK